MLSLVTWVRQFVSFLHCKVSPVPLTSRLLPLEGSQYTQLTLLQLGIMFYLLEAEVFHKFSGILLPEKSVSLFLFIQSFLYIRMDAWIFILYFALYSNTILFHLFQPVQLWPLGTLCWFLCPFGKFLLFCVCVVFYLLIWWEGTFLLFGTTRCPRLILCVSCPSSRFSHFSKKSWLPLLDNGLESSIWVTDVLCSSLLGELNILNSAI